MNISDAKEVKFVDEPKNIFNDIANVGNSIGKSVENVFKDLKNKK